MSPSITEKGQCANKFKLKIKNIMKKKAKNHFYYTFYFQFPQAYVQINIWQL